MYYYDKEAVSYITAQADARARVAAIDAIMTALLTTVLKAVGSGDVQEYLLNDGQTIIKTTYRDPEQVMKSVGQLRKLRQAFMQDTISRQVRLVDLKNINNTYPGR